MRWVGIIVAALALIVTSIALDGRSSTEILGVVVPHHNLVSEQRAAVFRSLKVVRPDVRTVILVSPNHYASGQGNVQTTRQVWHLSNGVIMPDESVIATLVERDVLVEDAGSFANEHGIRNILSDLERTYPNAAIVPLIFKTKTSSGEIEALNDALNESCRNCLLVASVDFSHYQTANIADQHDAVSIAALKTFDWQTLEVQAEVDSPAALSLLAQWSKRHGATQFTELAHTNSGRLLGTPDAETTSHVFGWYEGASDR